MAFITSFAPLPSHTVRSSKSNIRPAPSPATSSVRMGAYEDSYSAFQPLETSTAPDPSTYAPHYPSETVHCAPSISINRKAGFISVASLPVPLSYTRPVISAAYAGGPDPALWETYYPKSRVNTAPHIAFVGSESVAVSQLVVDADVESVQRTNAQTFESGWSAGWRPASRW